MAKIILTNGVVNVKEDFDTVTEKIMFSTSGTYVMFTEFDALRIKTDMAMGIKNDYRVLVNTNQIQCIKP